MTGMELKQGRLKAGLTQVQAAKRLALSQPYLSQLERERRAVTPVVERAAVRLYGLPPTALSPPDKAATAQSADELPRQLATLGYPGYSHLKKADLVNPAAVVLNAVAAEQLDGRVAAALPWVLQEFPSLDWAWLGEQVRRRNVQNRLGFLVSVARGVAERRSRPDVARSLAQVESDLEPSRLAAETTLGRKTMPAAERAWLRENRSPEARHWNVLAGMKAEDLPYAS